MVNGNHYLDPYERPGDTNGLCLLGRGILDTGMAKWIYQNDAYDDGIWRR